MIHESKPPHHFKIKLNFTINNVWKLNCKILEIVDSLRQEATSNKLGYTNKINIHNSNIFL